MHPLYPVARSLVGKYVYCAHLNGKIHYGILQSASATGVYLMPTRGIRPVTFDGQIEKYGLTGDSEPKKNISLVYFPGAYFAFGALTGLGLGLAFGARPYRYGYGGYGYGGYGGYAW